MPTTDPLRVFEGADSQFYVHLVAGNGQVLLSSEGYSRQEDAFRAARTIRALARQVPARAEGEG